MACYVHDLRPCLRGPRWPHTQSSHLIADTFDELMETGRRLKLKDEWIQKWPAVRGRVAAGGRGARRGVVMHYDLSPGKYREALGRGLATCLDRWAFWDKLEELRCSNSPPSIPGGRPA